jgi:hypothetical protein
MNFSDDFATFGCSNSLESDSITTRPTYVLNDLVTWIRGNHTFKVGGEYRNIAGNNHDRTNEQAHSLRARAHVAHRIDSGNPIASFLLGAVESSTLGVRTASNAYPRQKAWIVHAGDTWNVNGKLTLNLACAGTITRRRARSTTGSGSSMPTA